MITADHLPFVRVFEALSGLARGDLALYGEIAANALEAWAQRSGLPVVCKQLEIADGPTPRRWTVCRCRTADGFQISAHRDAVPLIAEEAEADATSAVDVAPAGGAA